MRESKSLLSESVRADFDVTLAEWQVEMKKLYNMCNAGQLLPNSLLVHFLHLQIRHFIFNANMQDFFGAEQALFLIVGF
jgi:hypothetical protein